MIRRLILVLGCLRIYLYKIRYGKRLILNYKNSQKPIFLGRGGVIRVGKDSIVELSGGDYFDDYVTIQAMDGGSCIFGENVFFNTFSKIYALNSVEIEKDCIAGSNVSIYDHDHNITPAKVYRKSGMTTFPVIVHENTWIGTNTVILKGSVIPYGCTIGANSVVKGALPERGVYTGTPVCLKRRI